MVLTFPLFTAPMPVRPQLWQIGKKGDSPGRAASAVTLDLSLKQGQQVQTGASSSAATSSHVLTIE